jgi:hypothetical protein
MLWVLRAVKTLTPPFMLALGITVGGGLVGGLGQWLAGQPAPDYAGLAWRLRIWAVAVAIGGAMTALENLERQFLVRGAAGALRDLAVVAVAYLGAQFGFTLITWLVRA